MSPATWREHLEGLADALECAAEHADAILVSAASAAQERAASTLQEQARAWRLVALTAREALELVPWNREL